MFDILDTSQIIGPFNALWSHNVVHNCDYVSFNVDCCYDILQHLLCICMPSMTSVKIQSIHHPTTLKPRNMLQLLTNKSILYVL